MAGQQRRGKRPRKGEQRQGTCVYCSWTGPVTIEHVFASSLYRVPPAEPVIVDACDRCNQAKSNGDWDLRGLTNLDVYGSQHPDAWWHIVQMAEKRPAFKTWLGRSVRDAEAVELLTPAGLSVGNLSSFPFNVERVIEGQKKVIRGLHYVETGQILPRSHNVHAVHLPWNVAIGLLQFIAGARPIHLSPADSSVAGWQSFELDDHPGEDRIWLIVYNHGVVFIGATGKVAEALRANTSEERLALLPRKVGPGQMQVPLDVEGRPILPPMDEGWNSSRGPRQA